MKKILMLLLSALFIQTALCQSWQVTFHPAEKRVSVPSMYACVYEDPDFTLQLRSDMQYIKVIMNQSAFAECTDTVIIELFTEDGEMKEMHHAYVNVGDDKSATVHYMKAVSWLMNGGKIKIIFRYPNKKVMVLRVEKMNRQQIIAYYYKYLDDIKS